jgi:hypothetical protein
VPLTAEKVETVDGGTLPAVRAPRWRRAAWLPAGLVAAWLVPVATNAAHVDILLLPLILVGVASLLRSGRTALDRLVLSGVLLYGGLCVLGLLFSVWPWHLEPVPIAGVTFSALVLISWGARRRPVLPLRYRPADLLVAGFGLFSVVFVLWPLRGRDPFQRLAMFMQVEDFSRHLMMYDTIRRVGGYMFLHWNPALRDTGAAGYLPYPQGSHFVTAVLENFVESSAVPATNPMVWTSHYVLWHVAGYAALCVVVLWAARWVAGPGASAARLLPVLALATAMMLFGETFTVYTGAYPQEVYALIPLAAFTAIMLRPLHRRREQLVAAGALFAAVGMSYYLFLPAAAVAAVGWLWFYRRRLWRNRVLALCCLVIGGAASVVIPIVMVTRLTLDVGGTLQAGGQLGAFGPGQATAVGLLAVGGALLLALRRSRVGWQVLVAVVGGLALSDSIYLFQRWHDVTNKYFFYKSLHAAMIIGVVCLGVATYLVPRTARAVGPRAGRWAAAWAPAVVLAVAAFAAFGGIPPAVQSAAKAYLTGPPSQSPTTAWDAYQLWRKWPDADGWTTVVWAGGVSNRFLATTYLGVYRQSYGPAAVVAVGMRPWEGPPPLSSVEKSVATSALAGQRYRFAATDPATLTELRRFAGTLPAGDVEVVDVSADLG